MLTGAMAPAGSSIPDAIFNIDCAIALVQTVAEAKAAVESLLTRSFNLLG